ncbi:hypothetical protein M378DRAFT_195788 [Amanita muscaria Koide BX008]|uniref:J domain-containing protein n=1 Tax=Amanita muscaria (strain Koide BX008) TaxID=946122 RepID=A0A0C2XLC5_AMAMK|nr:hypothetical protein M378DRAFT_195788 [Amanita muscaria Koide BX008]
MPSLADAYAVLGLSQGCTLEEVKAKYKQVALRTHPDKNPDNPDATIEFQRVSEAYRVISTRLDSDEGEEAFWDDYNDDDDGYNSDSDDEALMHIYMYIYTRLMNERRSRYQHFASEEAESEEEYQERMEEEAERRKKESDARKAYEKQQREKERQEAEERQKKKKETKKVKAKEKPVFQAAREGNTGKVKEGIYEFSVDASGGEVRPGCEKFVKNQPKDPQETLLHIAIKNGDADLVEYLDRHNAEPDERNSDGLTPVHLAIASGNLQIIKFFFETYSPKDADHQSIYQPPERQNLLTLASESLDPRVVDMIFSNVPWSAEEIKIAWDWVCNKDSEKVEDILAVFRRYGGGE